MGVNNLLRDQIMPSLLQIGLTNAVLSAVLAILVLAITRFCKNPHLAHALWIVVFLKMVTPPLISVPISFVSGENQKEFSSQTPRGLGTSPLSTIPAIGLSNDAAFESTATFEVLEERSSEPKRRASWPFYISVFWLGGSLLYAIVAGVRIVRFHAGLNVSGVPTDKLTRIGESVAKELGLKQCPALRVTDAQLGPMVWPIGRLPLVVFPRELMARLSEEQLRTIVAHEFAHIVRRDHWVRWLELVCSILYWWNPFLWLARKELRIAEEVCCDALVIETYPGSSRTIGEALLSIADFLSGITSRTPRMLMSEIQGSGILKRRIEMLLTNRSHRRLTPSVKGVLFVLSLVVLPLSAEESQKRVEVDSTKLDEAKASTSDSSEVGPTNSQKTSNATIEQILEAWQESSELLDTIQLHCAIELTEKVPTVPLKSDDPFSRYSFALKEDDFDFRTLKRRLEFSISGSQLGAVTRGETWDDKLAKPKERSVVAGFDGTQSKTFFPRSEYHAALVEAGPKPADILANSIETIPIMLACRPAATLSRKNIKVEEAEIVDQRTLFEGMPAIKLKIQYPSSVHFTEQTVSMERLERIVDRHRRSNPQLFLYVSRDQGHRILGMVSEYGGRKRRVDKLSYSPNDQVGWVLSGWKSDYYKQSGEPYIAIAAKVEEVAVNQPIDDSVFAPTSPAETHVQDETGSFIQE
jgi:beta-lactamase regulating signal transducer with metallopeptidase domain